MPNALRRPAVRPDLEGLRGLAALLVVLYHAGVPALRGGFVGVDVFFVLSGYFATRGLAREYAATGAVDVATFYGRRALRLLPALFVVLAATLVLAWAVYAPIDRAEVAAAARAAALGDANHAFARDAVDYFGRARSPLLHTWTLAVELQVSLVWPPLFLGLAALGAWRARRAGVADGVRRTDGLLRGVGPGLAVVAAVSFGVALWLTRTAPAWAFFGTAARAWEFALGGLVALAGLTVADGMGDPAAGGHAGGGRLGGWVQTAGLAAVAAAVAAYDGATPYPGAAALLPVLGAVGLVAGGLGGAAVGAGGVARLAPRVLAAPALRWLGGVSYGWYLWHWPLMVVGAMLQPDLGIRGRLAWSAAALGLAWLTRQVVERPAQALPGRWPASGVWLPAAAAATCVAAALGATGLQRSAERRALRPDQQAFAAAREDRMDHACWADGAAAPSGPCVFGDPQGRVTIALLGDSHAEHWLAAFDRLGRARGWRVLAMVKGGCPVSDAPELVEGRAERRGRACARYRAAMVRRIVAARPAVAVLSSFDGYVARDAGPHDAADRGRVPAAAWGRGLERTYARLAGAGVPVVALRGTPTPGFDVPACLSRRAAGVVGARACTYAREAALHPAAAAAQASAVRSAAARGLPVRLVDMTDAVCAAPRCDGVRGGRVVFTDDNHLTAGFTRAAAPALGARLDAALAPLGVRLP